jgi:hypothetical protein
MRVGKSISYVLLLLAVTALAAAAQELPRKIRGYTVHKADISVEQNTSRRATGGSDAVISLSEPKLKELTPAGLTLEVSAQIKSLAQSGKVDFLAFHGLQVNGIAVTVDEYREAFSFKKGESVTLPKPASIFVPTTQILRAAMREMRDSKKEWTITGRVFVFGKFRKFGFEHKRVVPIDINLTVANPIRS